MRGSPLAGDAAAAVDASYKDRPLALKQSSLIHPLCKPAAQSLRQSQRRGINIMTGRDTAVRDRSAVYYLGISMTQAQAQAQARVRCGCDAEAGREKGRNWRLGPGTLGARRSRNHKSTAQVLSVAAHLCQRP